MKKKYSNIVWLVFHSIACFKGKPGKLWIFVVCVFEKSSILFTIFITLTKNILSLELLKYRTETPC